MSCPICGNSTEKSYRPFCSRRCADVDLAKWMGGRYAIPASEPEGDEGPERPFSGDQGLSTKSH